jgi:hypothetical protein
MSKKPSVLINRYTKELLIVKTNLDLAKLLNISTATIKRKYKNAGIYESIVYTIYIGVETYDNNKPKNYKHNINPPIKCNDNSEH